MFKFFNIYYNYYCNEEGVIFQEKLWTSLLKDLIKILVKSVSLVLGRRDKPYLNLMLKSFIGEDKDLIETFW